MHRCFLYTHNKTITYYTIYYVILAVIITRIQYPLASAFINVVKQKEHLAQQDFSLLLQHICKYKDEISPYPSFQQLSIEQVK